MRYCRLSRSPDQIGGKTDDDEDDDGDEFWLID